MNVPTLDPTTSDNFEAMLKESINHFLLEFLRGRSDFSHLGSIFSRLIQGMTNPPLEFIWFYSAVKFHSSKSTLQDSSSKFLICKDAFDSLVSLYGSCNRLNEVFVLAPVLYQLYYLVCEFPSLREEVESLVETIVTYITICCCDNLQEQEIGLDKSGVCFLDLIPVWTVDRFAGTFRKGDDLRLFFPLLSDDVRFGIGMVSKTSNLAGVVMIEAFLLRLTLKFGSGVSKKELHKEVQSCAAQIIKGFQKNWAFLDMLLRMLLEPSLPIANLLKSEDEVLLRKVVFDAVLMDGGSLPSASGFTQLPNNSVKNVILLWLFVADTALHFARENGYRTQIKNYLSAFSESDLLKQLIKWINDQSSMFEKLNAPNISTPKALIKWLLVLENQGVKAFDLSISELHAKTVICKSRVNNKIPAFESVGETPNAGSDQEMVGSLDDHSSFSAAMACGRRKREEGMTVEEVRKQTKLVKYSFHESVSVDGLSSESEVENPPAQGFGGEVGDVVTDEEMEDMSS